MPIHRGVVRLEQQCSRLQGGLAELHATTGLQLNSMREMFRHRGMRLIFTANLISMIGSGMNAAAVIWYILQATHSEVSLGLLVALQTLPSLLLLPFTGVLIDREDRRHLMIWLDVCRGMVILLIAVLALTHHVRGWHVYGMTILVSIGFWMFWPTINAL